MKKETLVKAAVIFSATAVLAAGSTAGSMSAAGLFGEWGVAGISLSLQQYTENAEYIDDNNMLRTAPEDAQTLEAPEEETEEKVEEEKEEPVSEYADVGISIAANYVNIRKKPNTESKILGKLYKGCAATILETKGEWVKIKSGSVTGYINAEFLAIGFDAEELVDKYGTKWAQSTTVTLKVREKPTTESITLTLIPEGEDYQVLKEKDGWLKILLDEGDEGDEATTGWISGDYAKTRVEFEHAISIEEEEAEKKREEEARKAEEEQLRRLEEQRRQQQASSSNNSGSSGSSSSGSSNSGSSNSGSSNTSSGSESTGSVVGSGSGSEIASYAQKFVGNPYVYGGTSLTNGADCSGFVQSVYKHFGISIPRTSASQSGAGKKVSLDNLKEGDLIFYARNGRVNHVAMYIGGGQVVHASSPKTGIKISNYKYRTPYCARRIVE